MSGTVGGVLGPAAGRSVTLRTRKEQRNTDEGEASEAESVGGEDRGGKSGSRCRRRQAVVEISARGVSASPWKNKESRDSVNDRAGSPINRVIVNQRSGIIVFGLSRSHRHATPHTVNDRQADVGLCS